MQIKFNAELVEVIFINLLFHPGENPFTLNQTGPKVLPKRHVLTPRQTLIFVAENDQKC